MMAHQRLVVAVLVLWSLLVSASFCLGAEDQSPTLVSTLYSSAPEPKLAGTNDKDHTQV